VIWRRLGERVLSLLGVLLLLTFVVYAIQRLLPGDPARVLAGRTATPEALAAARERLGLDNPFLTEYFSYLGRLLHGDLGTSISSRRPVSDDVSSYLPATLELVLVASVLAVVGGLVIGIVGSRDGAVAAALRVLTVGVASAATFLLGVLALLVFYRNLGWFPAGGRTTDGADPGPTGLVLLDGLLHGDLALVNDAATHLVLPASVLAIGPAVAIGRVLRGSLRATLREDFVRSASAKGQSWSTVVRRHALRNAAGPALAMAGLQIGFMLSASVVVETIFSWPGLGNYLSTAIANSDLAAITGVVLVVGIAYVAVNFVVDMLQLLLDPRQREAA
jgi:peptide/nickel transport system permease protein